MGAIQQGVSNLLGTAAILAGGGKKLSSDAAEIERRKEQEELENRANIAQSANLEKRAIFKEEMEAAKDDPLYAETRAQVENDYQFSQGGFGELSKDDLIGQAKVENTTLGILAAEKAQKRIQLLRETDPTFKLREDYASGKISSFKEYQDKLNNYYIEKEANMNTTIKTAADVANIYKESMRERNEIMHALEQEQEEENK